MTLQKQPSTTIETSEKESSFKPPIKKKMKKKVAEKVTAPSMTGQQLAQHTKMEDYMEFLQMINLSNDTPTGETALRYSR